MSESARAAHHSRPPLTPGLPGQSDGSVPKTLATVRDIPARYREIRAAPPAELRAVVAAAFGGPGWRSRLSVCVGLSGPEYSKPSVEIDPL